MPFQMPSGNQQNYYMNQMMGNQMQGQLNQIGGQIGGLNQMNPMNQLGQMSFPTNSFQNNPNFMGSFQPKPMGIRQNPQSFPNNNINPQMFMNPYQQTGYSQNMMPNNALFMNNNMMTNKAGFMFHGVGGAGNPMPSKMGIFEMCQDQNGSRQIQQQFEHGNDQEKENIYNSIQESILILMKDVFGNYVVQKMFEKGKFH